MSEKINNLEGKLNAIILLLLKQSFFQDSETLERDKIKILSDIGLSNQELALLFSKTEGNISDQIYNAKRKKK